MNGIPYLYSMILIPLVASGAIGFLIGWFAQMSRKPTPNMDKAIERYQQAESARKELEAENQDMRIRLERKPTATVADDSELRSELEALRQQSADQRAASRALSESLEDAQAKLSASLFEKESLVSQIASMQSGAPMDSGDEVARLTAQVERLQAEIRIADDAEMNGAHRAEIEELRAGAAETEALRTRLAELSQEHERLERELIQARNAVAVNSGDDEEKVNLRQQLEKLQREMIALKMESEQESDSDEMIALRAMHRDDEAEISNLRELLRKRDMDLEQAITEAHNFRIAAQEVPDLQAKLAEANREGEIEQLKSDLEATRTAAAQQVQSLKEEKDQLTAAIADLRAERSALNDVRSHLDKVALERDQFESELLAARNEIYAMSEFKTQLEAMESESAAIAHRYDMVAQERDELEAALQQARASASALDELRGRIDTIESERAEIARRLEATARDRDELELALQQARSAPPVASVADDRSIELEASVASLEKRLEQAQSVAVEQSTIIANLETELAAKPVVTQEPSLDTAHFEAQISALERALGTVHIEKLRLEDELAKMREIPAVAAYEPPVATPPPVPIIADEPIDDEPVFVAEEEEAVVQEVPVVEPFMDDLDPDDLFADDDAPGLSNGFNVVQSAPDAQALEVVRQVERDLTPEEPKKKRAAPTIGSEGPDDLEEIIGIGPVARRTLVERGIDSYDKIAHLSPNQIDVLSGSIENFRDRLVREKWREQAKVLYRLKYGREI